jgi:acetolactate synthase-1/2/3 large subunit
VADIDGGEILVRGLVAEGVEIIFAIADISYSPIFRSAEDKGIRLVGGRHESAEVHMAEAWARVTGGIAVAMAGMGPGVANLVPGVINAWIEGAPVVVIATQRTERADRAVRRGRFQYTPQIDVFRPVTKYAGKIPDARRIPEYLREAFRFARSGRPGPVYLEVADEVLRQTVAEEKLSVPEPSRYRPVAAAPAQDAVEEAARMIAEAKEPLLLAGQGVLWADASGALVELAEHAGALMMSTSAARGAVPEHHLHAPNFNLPGGTTAAQQADLVLAVGTQVGEMMGYGRPPRWGQPASQRWIQLDCDPASIGVNREVDQALVGDAKLGLAALTKALREILPKRPLSDAAARHVAGDHEIRTQVLASFPADSDRIHPGYLAARVAEFFPADAIACFDGGNTGIWAHLAHQIQTPRSFLWSGHFGHLGTGLPYAIGAKLAHPNRPVYLFTGDSAFGFNLQELETAAREKLDINIIINCDFAWGMERLGQQLEIGRVIGVDTSHTRYDEVARGMGCHGELIEKSEEIIPALERAAAHRGPAVVQALVDVQANAMPPGLAEFAAMYSAKDD